MIGRTSLTMVLGMVLYIPSAALYAESTVPDDQGALLKMQVSIDLTNMHSPDVLQYVASTYRIPCGVQISSANDSKGHSGDISLHLSHVSLKTALDALVAADSRYRWELDSGVVNLIPVNESGSMLNIEMAHISIQNTSQSDAEKQILELPEIRAGLRKLNLKPGHLDVWTLQKKKDDLRISINVEHTTLQHLLNKIAKQTGFWSSAAFGDYFWLSLGESSALVQTLSHPN